MVVKVSDESLFTAYEVAHLLRVTPMSVYRWIKLDKITAVKVGRSWRIPASELNRIRQEGTS